MQNTTKLRSLRSITLEEVVAAYKETGLKPAAGHFFVADGRTCALGAIMHKAGGEHYCYDDKLRTLGFDYYGLVDFGISFDAGFKGMTEEALLDLLESPEGVHENAVEIGKAIRQMVDEGKL